MFIYLFIQLHSIDKDISQIGEARTTVSQILWGPDEMAPSYNIKIPWPARQWYWFYKAGTSIYSG